MSSPSRTRPTHSNSRLKNYSFVITATRRGLCSFTSTLENNVHIRRLPYIVHPRSFELQRPGVRELSIGEKDFKHEPMYTGISTNDTFAGSSPTLFIGGIHVVKLTPAFELNVVDDTIVRDVATRYEAADQRVGAIYLLGDVELLRYSRSCIQSCTH